MEFFIYIAGPMSGYPDHNRQAFLRAGQLWEHDGNFTVFNPISSPVSRLVQSGKMSGQEAYRQCLGTDLDWICYKATHIYMLKGWEKSPGARAEHATATALGLEIIYERDSDYTLFDIEDPRSSHEMKKDILKSMSHEE